MGDSRIQASIPEAESVNVSGGALIANVRWPHSSAPLDQYPPMTHAAPEERDSRRCIVGGAVRFSAGAAPSAELSSYACRAESEFGHPPADTVLLGYVLRVESAASSSKQDPPRQ